MWNRSALKTRIANPYTNSASICGHSTATPVPFRARLRLLGSRLVAEPGHLIGVALALALALALAYLVLAPMLAVLMLQKKRGDKEQPIIEEDA